MPASAAARATSPANRYMSQNEVVPERIISHRDSRAA